MTCTLATFLATLLVSGPGVAAKPPAAGTIDIWPDLRITSNAADAEKGEGAAFNKRQAALANRPVMVSLMSGGKVIRQGEALVTDPRDGVYRGIEWKDLAPGAYDVRFEAEGVQTVLKKGVLVTPGGETRVRADLLGGKGVRVIEYGTDASGMDLADRLEKLEAELRALKKSR
jgi:hypothetical protein